MMIAALLGQSIDSRRAATVVAALVIARFLVHAFHVPVFEGPDEPFHLSRAVSIASQPVREGLAAPHLSPEIVGAIRAHPCGADLQRAFGCSPFAGEGAFNIIAEPSSRAPETKIQNYEAHQPPLYYVAAGLLFRLSSVSRWSPERQLLALRLLSVAVVAVALILWLRTPRSSSAFFVPLLLPGAAESLARGANDAFLFTWTALSWIAFQRKSRLLVLLAAAGPLIKLTAFPVIAAAAALLWLDRQRNLALMTAVASLIVFPLQALRGWAWGGTLEANLAGGAMTEAPLQIAIGLARSMYTFAKTTFWLGEWSFFRPPLWLVATFFVIVIGFAFTARPKADRERWMGHGVGLIIAVAGLFTFAILNRKLFGTWGGVGGWYAWGWYPWLGALSVDLLVMRSHARLVAAVFALFVIVTNMAWFVAATKIYGI